jgi:hypothetical protein
MKDWQHTEMKVTPLDGDYQFLAYFPLKRSKQCL